MVLPSMRSVSAPRRVARPGSDRHYRRRAASGSNVDRPACGGGHSRIRHGAVYRAAARERTSDRQPQGRPARRRIASQRDVHGLAESAQPDRLHGGDRGGTGRGHHREQQPQRAGQPGRPQAARADDRGSAGIRAQLSDSRAQPGSRARDRFGRPQRQERRVSRHVSGPGGRRTRLVSAFGISRDARRPVRIRRDRDRERRRRFLHARAAGAGRRISSPSAAADCSCSAGAPSSSAG